MKNRRKYPLDPGQKYRIWWGPILVNIEVVGSTARKVKWNFLSLNEKHKNAPASCCPWAEPQSTWKSEFVEFLKKNRAVRIKDKKRKRKNK